MMLSCSKPLPGKKDSQLANFRLSERCFLPAADSQEPRLFLAAAVCGREHCCSVKRWRRGSESLQVPAVLVPVSGGSVSEGFGCFSE